MSVSADFSVLLRVQSSTALTIKDSISFTFSMPILLRIFGGNTNTMRLILETSVMFRSTSNRNGLLNTYMPRIVLEETGQIFETECVFHLRPATVIECFEKKSLSTTQNLRLEIESGKLCTRLPKNRAPSVSGHVFLFHTIQYKKEHIRLQSLETRPGFPVPSRIWLWRSYFLSRTVRFLHQSSVAPLLYGVLLLLRTPFLPVQAR